MTSPAAYKVSPEDSSVLGIKDVLTTDRKRVDVILVHGMCTHNEDWVVNTNNQLAKALGSPERLTHSTLPPPHQPSKGTQVYPHVIEVGDHSVFTHSIVWSGETAREKATLCYDRDDNREKSDAAYCLNAPPDKPEPANEHTRASANRLAKNKLMNDCLADAMVYVGPKKEQIQASMRRAIELSLDQQSESKIVPGQGKNPNDEPTTPLFLVTESLGSKIFFDTLLSMVPKQRELVARTIERTAQIFMGANQIPILSLSAPLPRDLRSERGDSLPGLLEMFGDRQLQFKRRIPVRRQVNVDRIEVVAFTDPNDLLSYPLLNSRQAQGKQYRFIDVIVSNDYTWFGFLENPWAAHTGYLSNKQVHRVIACGLPMESC